MAATSTVATRIGPQVFISFQGQDVRNHFAQYIILASSPQNAGTGTAIANIRGMPLAEQSDTADYHFIESIVVLIQRFLDHVAVRGNPREASRQGGFTVPAIQL
ncbi:protein PHLOEM PROTEIN 2-LIKE A8-like isoform X2 [Raphanus sativus]|uniref:Protein PHLOEM PROTEIN 2-LIKE A8-like isoform X2 n=1 Tax=Raphanus sativus TaxID=3726 RepID=A0A6J0N2I0_RAPSA|nr:protein PHLOEM PROTEIN 2-LIKE A8-like isoform X2 [Raphanus sativus]